MSSKIFLLFLLVKFSSSQNFDYNKVTFSLYSSDGKGPFNYTNSTKSNCSSSEKFSFIIPNIRDDVNSEWLGSLIKNLRQYRGGCILLMLYNPNSYIGDYRWLLESIFDNVVNLLAAKTQQLVKEGLTLRNGFYFGYGYGGLIALKAGLRLNGTLGRIDVCDPAGFDTYFIYLRNIYNSMGVKTQSAQFVQCIHTSIFPIYTEFNCHMDFVMGSSCGRSQNMWKSNLPRIMIPNDLACPILYNSAFEFDFKLKSPPTDCPIGRDLISYDFKKFPNVKMGYLQEKLPDLKGVLFAGTACCYPHVENLNITLGIE